MSTFKPTTLVLGLVVWALLLATSVRTFANHVVDKAPNVVTDWAAIVQPAIHNAGAPRSAGTALVLHTMVMLAIYDATMAIEGGFTPYAAHIRAPKRADVRAAVATAAYLTARARVAPPQYAYLDEQYAAYLAAIPEGQAKARGIRVGEQAAEATLTRRDSDGFDAVVPYFCRAVPPLVGEFEPDAGCPAQPTDPQPADAKVGQIRPFTFSDPARFRPGDPVPLASDAYAADFVETRDYGRADSGLRSPEQTDIAYFWSENPYVFWNRNLINLAIDRRLSVRDAARFFAMVYTTASDAVIAGFEAKYFYTSWRPRTAIPRAELDGNPRTDPDPGWTPLLKVNHPEYPSGHGFWTTAVAEAVASFFRTDRIHWTLVVSKTAVPQIVRTERTYRDLGGILRDMENARVWAGLHWRHSMRQGARIGRAVARHVARHFFSRRHAPLVVMRIYDGVYLPASTVAALRAAAESAFAPTGIRMDWRQCAEAHPKKHADCAASQAGLDIVVRVTERHHAGDSGRRCGLAVAMAAGGFISLSRDCAARTVSSLGSGREPEYATEGEILGYTLAHELAHVLLPGVPHSSEGLFTAHLQRRHWRRLRTGHLAFLPQDVERLREAAVSTSVPSAVALRTPEVGV